MQMLWCLEQIMADTIRDQALWYEGLHRHLRHHGLSTVLVQHDTHQRAYLTLPACAGCASGRCEPGCYVELFRRLLRACSDGALRLVPHGLTRMTYPQQALAWPTRDAAPLDSTLLQPWPTARLTQYWGREHGANSLSTLVVLAASERAPHPRHVLQARGWRAVALPAIATRRQWPLPGSLFRLLHPWPGEPYLLLPVSSHSTQTTPAAPSAMAPTDSANDQPEDDEPLVRVSAGPGPAGGSNTPGPNILEGTQPAGSVASTTTSSPDLAQRLVTQLTPLLAEDPAADDAYLMAFSQTGAYGQRTTPTVPSINVATADERIGTAVVEALEEQSLWPAGPGRMRAAEVGFLIEQIQTSPIVQGSEPGVTRKRLVQLLPDDLGEYARQLMLWFDQAGILAAPAMPDEPFRNPRALITAIPEQLAERLAATPIPTPEAARAAMHRSK